MLESARRSCHRISLGVSVKPQLWLCLTYMPLVPLSSDALRLGSAARFNLSMMHVPASMNEEDRKILDSDNDDNLPSVRQILVSSKRKARDRSR
jgi:hypothetical protein